MEKLALLASIGVADVIGTAAAADDQGTAILKEVAKYLFFNRLYSLLSFGRPQLYDLEAMSFTYSVGCFD